MLAAIGPAIGPCCYEVGMEVAGQFEKEFLRPGFSDRPYLDLWETAVASLRAAGLTPNHISIARMCTACNADLFPSWRRDGATEERMVSLIVPPTI